MSSGTSTIHSGDRPKGSFPIMKAPTTAPQGDEKTNEPENRAEALSKKLFEAVEYATEAVTEAAKAAKDIQDLVRKGEHSEAILAELSEAKRTVERITQEKLALEKQVRTLQAEKTMSQKPGGAGDGGATREKILALIRRKIDAAKDLGGEEKTIQLF